MRTRFTAVAAAFVTAMAVLVPVAAPPTPADARVCISGGGDLNYCWDELPDIIHEVYDKVGAVFPWTLPGSVGSEVHGGGGGSPPGRGGSSGPRPDPKPWELVANPLPSGTRPRELTVVDASGTSRRLSNVLDLDHYTKGATALLTVQYGETRVYGLRVDFGTTFGTDLRSLANIVFVLFGSDVQGCRFTGTRADCLLSESVRLPLMEPGSGGVYKLAPSPSSTRLIPFCAGLVEDAGPGLANEVTVDDVSCDYAPDRRPVGLRVVRSTGSEAVGQMLTSPDGTVTYAATEQAQGRYVSAEVVAVLDNGMTSLPFPVVMRNRFAPSPVAGGTHADVIRGTETVVPRQRIFEDVDADEHYSESLDTVRGEVLTNGTQGHAFFDAAGNLHYFASDAVEGEVHDSVIVRAVDSFGLWAEPTTVEFTVTDVVPSCANGNVTTDSATPVLVHVECRIDGPVGYHQLKWLEYSIVRQPSSGTLSDFDPVAGVALYTPDSGHAGPVTFEFAASNNGAIRTTQFAIDVQPAPVPEG